MVGARVKTIMDMCLYGCDTSLVRHCGWAVWKAEVLLPRGLRASSRSSQYHGMTVAQRRRTGNRDNAEMKTRWDGGVGAGYPRNDAFVISRRQPRPAKRACPGAHTTHHVPIMSVLRMVAVTSQFSDTVGIAQVEKCISMT